MSDKELEKLNARTIFVRDAMPSSWLEHADELRNAAELLWNDRSNGLRAQSEQFLTTVSNEIIVQSRVSKRYAVSRPYVLLAGLALENLLKAILVARDPSLINTGALSDELKTHNLLKLAEQVGDVELGEKGRQFCEMATEAVPYWGRYPIPLNHTGLLPEIGMDDALHTAYLTLHDRLATRLYRMIKNGWDSLVGPQQMKLHIMRYEELGQHDGPY